MLFNRCPFCHKLFAAQVVSKEQVDSKIDKDTLAPAEAARIAQGRRTPKYGPTDYPEQAFIAYKILYRCKHCGKEWAKLSEKEMDIPRNYAQD